jgi:hypothetical protein
MLLSIIGELRVGTSPRPVMATRLIVPEGLARGRFGTVNCLSGANQTLRPGLEGPSRPEAAPSLVLFNDLVGTRQQRGRNL